MNVDEVKSSDVVNGFIALAEKQTDMGARLSEMAFELSILSIEYDALTQMLKCKKEEVLKILNQIGGEEE